MTDHPTMSTTTKPAPPPLRMRKLDLNVPADFYERMYPPTRGPFGLQNPAPKSNAKPISKSELKSWIEKILSKKIKVDIISHKNGLVRIDLSGATAEFTPDPGSKDQTALGVKTKHDGTVEAYKAHTYSLGPDSQLKEKVSTAMGQPFRLEYKHKQLAIALTFKSNDEKGMSFDRWKFTVSWGNVGPDLQSLGKIVTKAEESARGALVKLTELKSLDDMSSVVDAIGPIKKSVDTAASLMKPHQNINIRFDIQGPCKRVRLPVNASLEDYKKAEVKGMIYLTVRF